MSGGCEIGSDDRVYRNLDFDTQSSRIPTQNSSGTAQRCDDQQWPPPASSSILAKWRRYILDVLIKNLTVRSMRLWMPARRPNSTFGFLPILSASCGKYHFTYCTRGRDRCFALSHWSNHDRPRAARFFPRADAGGLCGRQSHRRRPGFRLCRRAHELRCHNVEPSRKASMAYDLEHGRRLELDWLTGKVRALGRTLGIPTLANDAGYIVLKLHRLGS